MGVELYITRADFWAENEEAQITPEEWLSLIDSDNELTIDLKNGDYHALWSGASSHDEAWLDWNDGNIYTKWPDTQLYRKMLDIAGFLGAQVMDDDSNIYSDPSAWEYDPPSTL